MRAIVLDRPGTCRAGGLPDPVPRPTENVVKVDRRGTRGTDLHIPAGEIPPTPGRGLAEPGGARFGVAIDATGMPAAIGTAIGPLGRGGPTPAFGVSPAGAVTRVSSLRIYNDELTIVGSLAVLHGFGPAAGLPISGAADPQSLLSEPLSLDQFGEAVNRVRSGQGVKWRIRPS